MVLKYVAIYLNPNNLNHVTDEQKATNLKRPF